jgi:hypothetical protein
VPNPVAEDDLLSLESRWHRHRVIVNRCKLYIVATILMAVGCSFAAVAYSPQGPTPGQTPPPPIEAKMLWGVSVVMVLAFFVTVLVALYHNFHAFTTGKLVQSIHAVQRVHDQTHVTPIREELGSLTLTDRSAEHLTLSAKSEWSVRLNKATELLIGLGMIAGVTYFTFKHGIGMQALAPGAVPVKMYLIYWLSVVVGPGLVFLSLRTTPYQCVVSRSERAILMFGVRNVFGRDIRRIEAGDVQMLSVHNGLRVQASGKEIQIVETMPAKHAREDDRLREDELNKTKNLRLARDIVIMLELEIPVAV